MQIEVKRWFDVAQTDLATLHKTACEKSIKKKGCVRVFEGAYYYKGFYIFRNCDRRWSWRTLGDTYTLEECTKKECIESIECFINKDKIYKELTI